MPKMQELTSEEISQRTFDGAYKEINGTYYLYGLGCYLHKDCFTCEFGDCKCNIQRTLYEK